MDINQSCGGKNDYSIVNSDSNASCDNQTSKKRKGISVDESSSITKKGRVISAMDPCSMARGDVVEGTKETPNAASKTFTCVTFNCPNCLKDFTFNNPRTAAASFALHTRACKNRKEQASGQPDNDEVSSNSNTVEKRKKSSKYTGVSYFKNNKKWQAVIYHEKKTTNLGYTFSLQCDAALAYDKAAIQMKGSNANTNFSSKKDDKVNMRRSPRGEHGLDEAKNQLLNHRRKLLACVRETRLAAEERVRKMRENETLEPPTHEEVDALVSEDGGSPNSLDATPVADMTEKNEPVVSTPAASSQAIHQQEKPLVVSATPSQPEKHPGVIAVSVSRPKEAKLGLGIATYPGERLLTVASVAPNSLFDNTALKVGMVVYSINGESYSSFEKGSTLLTKAEGQLTLLCAPHPNTAIVNALREADATRSTRSEQQQIDQMNKISSEHVKGKASIEKKSLNSICIKIDGGEQITVQFRQGANLSDVRKAIVDHKAAPSQFKDGHFFIQIGPDLISKKMETTHYVNDILKEGLAITLVPKSSLKEDRNTNKASATGVNIDRTLAQDQAADVSRVNEASQTHAAQKHAESSKFIARVKKTFEATPDIFNRFLDLAMKVKAKEIDVIDFARLVLSLFKGRNDIILGFFSFLPDTNGSESSFVKEEAEMARFAMVKLKSEQVEQISSLLIGQISKILVTQPNHTGLGSILHSLKHEDSRFVAIFPTNDSLRIILTACYYLLIGDSKVDLNPNFVTDAVMWRQVCDSINLLIPLITG